MFGPSASYDFSADLTLYSLCENPPSDTVNGYSTNTGDVTNGGGCNTAPTNTKSTPISRNEALSSSTTCCDLSRHASHGHVAAGAGHPTTPRPMRRWVRTQTSAPRVCRAPMAGSRSSRCRTHSASITRDRPSCAGDHRSATSPHAPRPEDGRRHKDQHRDCQQHGAERRIITPTRRLHLASPTAASPWDPV